MDDLKKQFMDRMPSITKWHTDMQRKFTETRLEELGFKVYTTAGFTLHSLGANAEYTHGDGNVKLEGRYTARELRAMADYIEAHK